MDLFSLFSFLILAIASLGQASKCPLNSKIAPCTCSSNFVAIDIQCGGPGVNQTTVGNVFGELRRVNGIPQDHGLPIHVFRLEQTGLTQLDLAPFYGSQIDFLTFTRNELLTKLVTSGSAEGHGSIRVKYLTLWHSPLNSQGLGEALKYFSNEMTSFDARYVDLSDYNKNNQSNQNNNISDGGQFQFLSGLSAHTNLRNLYFDSCHISGRLNSNTLIPKELTSLRSIQLWGNRINEIGENVFDFNGGFDASLEIGLGQNQLNESSFHPNSGIAKIGRKTTLQLHKNQITTLPAPIFQSFLDAHPKNYIQLYGNPLVCDERVGWVKSRREESGFQRRVLNAECSNDKGHTLFDSDLVSGGGKMVSPLLTVFVCLFVYFCQNYY